MNIYSFYHLNLSFSSIEENEIPHVIDTCYLPLLNLCLSENYKIGIEISGYSLEKICQYRPDWITQFKVSSK